MTTTDTNTTTARVTIPVTFQEFKEVFNSLKKEGVQMIHVLNTDYTISTSYSVSRSGIMRYTIIRSSDGSSSLKTLSSAFSFLREEANKKLFTNKSYTTFLEAVDSLQLTEGLTELKFYNHLEKLEYNDLLQMAVMMEKNLKGSKFNMRGKVYTDVNLRKDGDQMVLDVYGKLQKVSETAKEAAQKMEERR